MRPTVLVDMDGPLAAFDDLFFERCAANGWEVDCTLDHQTHRYATDHIPDQAHRAAARRMVDTAGWFRDLRVVPGSREGLAELAAVAHVWIVTKPLASNPTCACEKTWWVKTHLGSTWVDRLVIAPDKSIVRGDILLDDAPKLSWLPRAEWRPVIYPAPFNRAGSQWAGIPAWCWRDGTDALLKLIRAAGE